MILVAGDSHSRFWKNCPDVTTMRIGEATAYGLWDGQKYGTKAKMLVGHLSGAKRRYSGIVCVFGEIDCRAHVVKRAVDGDIAGQVRIVVDRYRAFLEKMRELTGRRVCSIGPPCAASDDAPIDGAFPRAGTRAQREYAIECFDRMMNDGSGTHFRIADLMTPADLPDGVHAGEHLRRVIDDRVKAAFA